MKATACVPIAVTSGLLGNDRPARWDASNPFKCMHTTVRKESVTPRGPEDTQLSRERKKKREESLQRSRLYLRSKNVF